MKRTVRWVVAAMAVAVMTTGLVGSAVATDAPMASAVEVAFTLEVDCHDEAIYLVLTSTAPVDLVGFQVPIEWPEGVAPTAENLADGDGDGIPDGSIVGFVGPPGESLTDGDAVWTWNIEIPDGEPLSVTADGVDVARFTFDELPDFIRVAATGLGGIPAKALAIGGPPFPNLWDGDTGSWSFVCWASQPKPQGPNP